jgi:hypothetical protein
MFKVQFQSFTFYLFYLCAVVTLSSGPLLKERERSCKMFEVQFQSFTFYFLPMCGCHTELVEVSNQVASGKSSHIFRQAQYDLMRINHFYHLTPALSSRRGSGAAKSYLLHLLTCHLSLVPFTYITSPRPSPQGERVELLLLHYLLFTRHFSLNHFTFHTSLVTSSP